MTKKISYWDVKYNRQKNPWINQISNQYSINISEISKPKTIEEKEEEEKNNPMTYIEKMTYEEIGQALNYEEIFSDEEMNTMLIVLTRLEDENERKNILLDK